VVAYVKTIKHTLQNVVTVVYKHKELVQFKFENTTKNKQLNYTYMNTLQTIYNKLSDKTELAKHEVQLALVDDYNARIDKANNERKSASVSYQKLIGAMQAAVINLELAVKEADKIDKASKEIGVQSPVNSTRVKAKLTEYVKVVSALNALQIKGGDDI